MVSFWAPRQTPKAFQNRPKTFPNRKVRIASIDLDLALLPSKLWRLSISPQKPFQDDVARILHQFYQNIELMIKSANGTLYKAIEVGTKRPVCIKQIDTWVHMDTYRHMLN